MTMDTPRTGQIRTAVASGDWRTALRLWDVYAAGIREEIGRGACSQARMAEAREFLDWAGRVVLCARAQTQNRLNTIFVAKQYGPSPSRPPSSLRTSL
jgi:hypothetical protein